jgi:hypothetical protein
MGGPTRLTKLQSEDIRQPLTEIRAGAAGSGRLSKRMHGYKARVDPSRPLGARKVPSIGVLVLHNKPTVLTATIISGS